MFSLFKRKKESLFNGYINDTNFSKKLSFRDDGGLILITLSIANDRYTFMLDTGAFSVVPKNLLTTDNLTQLDETIYTLDASGEKKESTLYRLHSLELAGIHFNDFSVIVDDFAKDFPLSCLQFDGILGYNFLQKFILEINYEEKYIQLFDSYKKDKSFTAIKLIQTKSNAPSFQIYYNAKSYLVGLDTGNNDHLLINDPALIQELEIEGNSIERITGTFSTTFSGQNRYSFIDRYLLKNFTIEKKILVESTQLIFQEESLNIAGNAFLSQFHLVLDLEKKKLFLKKRDKNILKKEQNRFGFITFWNEEKKLYISAIIQGSPAYNSKLKIGDKIMSINELDTLNFSQEEYCKHTLRSKRVMLYDEDDTELSIIVKRNGKLIREQLSLSL